VPEHAFSKYYRLVNEVVFGFQCLRAAQQYPLSSEDRRIRVDRLVCDLEKCLNVVTSSNSLAESLHINMHRDRRIPYEYDDLGAILGSLDTAIPCQYEFFDFRVSSSSKQLYMAYNLQGIVHYFFIFTPNPSNIQFQVAQLLARQLDGCFEEEDINSPAGQIFLCDTIVPYIISTLEELRTIETIEDTALIKICKFITVWPDLSKSPYKSKLDFLKSRVKLVKPGFRPSLADLFPTPQAGLVSSLNHMWEEEDLMSRQSLTHVLLEEDDLLAPVQLRDDDGGSSSDEYSGVETSDSGSDIGAEAEDED